MRTQAAGRAIVMGISSTSGGTGKKDDSANDVPASTGIAPRESAMRMVKS